MVVVSIKLNMHVIPFTILYRTVTLVNYILYDSKFSK